jgi:hypothetical protein
LSRIIITTAAEEKNEEKERVMENLIFDYKSLGEDLSVPREIIKKFEKEARME